MGRECRDVRKRVPENNFDHVSSYDHVSVLGDSALVPTALISIPAAPRSDPGESQMPAADPARQNQAEPTRPIADAEVGGAMNAPPGEAAAVTNASAGHMFYLSYLKVFNKYVEGSAGSWLASLGLVADSLPRPALLYCFSGSVRWP